LTRPPLDPVCRIIGAAGRRGPEAAKRPRVEPATVLSFRVPKLTRQWCATTDHRSILAIAGGTRFVCPTRVASRACPKCRTDRTRRIGVTNYHRCDACEYLFSIGAERVERSDSSAAHRQRSAACPKCRGDRTRIVGQTSTPPLIHRRCDGCGHVFSRPLD